METTYDSKTVSRDNITHSYNYFMTGVLSQSTVFQMQLLRVGTNTIGLDISSPDVTA